MRTTRNDVARRVPGGLGARLLAAAGMLILAAGCGGDGETVADETAGQVSAAASAVTIEPSTVPPTSSPHPSVAPGPTIVETTPTPPPTVAATTTTVPAVDSVDWANLVYDAECGAVSPLPLVDGRFAPVEYNGRDDVLTVEYVGVEPIVTRPDAVLVHLSCVAGGPGAALSAELFFVFTVADGAAEQRLAVDSAPAAQHVIDSDGVVVIDEAVHAADDPVCCPSQRRTRQIVWDGDEPRLVEGARPGEPAAADGCIASELRVGWPQPDDVERLETALAAAGFDPGSIDGALDAATIDAVVDLIEFNADNPAIHGSEGAPYDNLHAEALDHGVVRRPVLSVLGIACADVAELPRS